MHHIAFALSQATFRQTVERLDERGIRHSGVKDRGFMDSIYFEDPLGLLIELASYRFEPPLGYTHADVLLEAHKLRVERGDYNIDRGPPRRRDRGARPALAAVALGRPRPRRIPTADGGHMAAITLNILKPSVNNLTVRIFVRAAGLDFEEVDVWGKTREPEYLAKYPAHLTPMIEEEGLPRGSLWESCAIMAYLCNKHGLDRFYPTDPAQRAMVDNAMFYVIGTLYPLITRATYPTLGFPQYPGEVGSSDADDAAKKAAIADATEAVAEPLDVFRDVLPRRQAVHRRRLAVDRRHPPGRVARVPERDRLRLPGLGARLHGGDGRALGDAYSEPAADVRGYIEYVRSQTA